MLYTVKLTDVPGDLAPEARNSHCFHVVILALKMRSHRYTGFTLTIMPLKMANPILQSLHCFYVQIGAWVTIANALEMFLKEIHQGLCLSYLNIVTLR